MARCGITPLILAAENGKDAVVDQMMAKGADITEVNQFGGTALTMAIQHCRCEEGIDDRTELTKNVVESLLRVRKSPLLPPMSRIAFSILLQWIATIYE